jgi:hypothetical protein
MNAFRTLRAALALAVAGAAAAPALALQNADLKTTMTANVATVAAGGSLTYAVTIANLAAYRSVCVFDPELRRRVCEPVVDSPAVTGVVVDIAFSSAPSGTPAVSGDSGFGSCLQLGATQFRCQGATIQPEDAAHISVQLHAPNAGGTFTVSAQASAPAVTERSTTNNGASVAVTVLPPPNTNLPDLFAIVYGPSTFDGVKAVDFQVRIYNQGPVDAVNASLEYHSISAASMGTPQFVGGGSPSCTFYFTWNGLPGLQCSGLNVPAYNSVLMNLRMAPGPFLPTGSVFGFLGMLDPNYTTQELNEQNNLYSGILTVVR